MKSNCISLYVSIAICSMSFIIILLPECWCDSSDVFLNILVGTFSSGLVSLLLLIPSYNVSKAKLLNDYWEEFYRLIRIFDKTSYLFIEYNAETLIDYIHELNNKEFFEKRTNNINTIIPEEESRLKCKLIKQYIHNHSNDNKNLGKLNNYKNIEKVVDKDIKEIRKKLKMVCKEYIEISKENTIKLDRMLDEMQFFVGTKRMKSINNLTYRKMFEAFNKVYVSSFHIKSYIDGHCNESIALSEVINLQAFLYEFEIEEDDNSKTYIINQKFVSDMISQLEDFNRKKNKAKKKKQDGFKEYITLFKSDISYLNRL